MSLEKIRVFIFFISLFTFFYSTEAQEVRKDRNEQALEFGTRLIEKYFEEDTNWQVTDPKAAQNVRGLIQFIEKQPLDSILVNLNEWVGDSTYRFVYRLPEFVSDSLQLPGFYPSMQVQKDLEAISLQLKSKYFEKELSVPVSLITDMEKKAGIIPPGEGYRLFETNIYEFPDSLKIPEVIPESLMNSPADYQRYFKLDSFRNVYIEQKRLAYNDSIVNAFRDALIEDYRNRRFREEFETQRRELLDSVNQNNYQVLKQYNDSIVRTVNDSIAMVIGELAAYADYIDTARITVTNFVDEEFPILLQSGNTDLYRVWLKNVQNDSLRILVKNTDKRTLQMTLDDGVTFSRFKPRETKSFDFSTLNREISGLTNVGEKYLVLTPWRIGGDGNVGFTQAYLENWKKGGQSALSLQIILKGYANYSRFDGKVKWENSGEIRNGYIRPGGEGAELQKNDDKFEVTSRLGVSAFKKWYYSTEFNYETQLFKGFRYPKSSYPEPISAFMSPARTFFKLGLDYKPNKDFSLLLSPLTAKHVYVRDTVNIDQTRFGIEKGKKDAWEPGLNTDIFYRRNLTPNLTYETKYKMFINYIQPFGNLDINWENQFVMKVNDHINVRMLLHLIYDENVLFPVYDANDLKTGEKPKLQVKEFITIGFSYKINRLVTRTRRK